MIFLTFFQPFSTVGTLFALTFGRNEKCSVLFYQKKGWFLTVPPVVQRLEWDSYKVLVGGSIPPRRTSFLRKEQVMKRNPLKNWKRSCADRKKSPAQKKTEKQLVMAEWSKAADCKSVWRNPHTGSNPVHESNFWKLKWRWIW